MYAPILTRTEWEGDAPNDSCRHYIAFGVILRVPGYRLTGGEINNKDPLERRALALAYIWLDCYVY